MRKELLKMPKTKSGAPATGYKSSWEYFDMMYFLKNVILPAPTTGNLASSCLNNIQTDEEKFSSDESVGEEGEESFREVETPEFQVPVSSPDCVYSSRSSSVTSQRRNVSLKRKSSGSHTNRLDSARLELERKKIQILQESSAVDKQFMQNVNNADYNFLMSLLPFIEPLTLTEKLDLREKLQKEVHDAYKKHEQMQSASAQPISNSHQTVTHTMWSPGSSSDYIPNGQLCQLTCGFSNY